MQFKCKCFQCFSFHFSNSSKITMHLNAKILEYAWIIRLYKASKIKYSKLIRTEDQPPKEETWQTPSLGRHNEWNPLKSIQGKWQTDTTWK